MMKENEMPSGNRARLEAHVRAHPFLVGISDHHIQLLVDCALSTAFENGEVIFRAGEIANRFYLIETGQVVLESGEDLGTPIIIDQIGPGDLLGWSWIFPPYIWHFSAGAVARTQAIFFYGTILREYCEKDPVLGYELFKRMSEVMIKRLQRARSHLIVAMKSTPAHSP